MELLHYLRTHFFTSQQLLARSAIDAEQLRRWQERRMMPQPSYCLNLDISCDSFFGHHTEHQRTEFYAKGYVSWIELLHTLDSEDQALAVFARRYRERLDQLAGSGVTHPNDFATGQHLAAEWNHFLDGTYGLCTVSGLPEDIAAKEVAIAIIRDADDRDRLRQAIDLLDAVSSPFAPHEVARSSRRRYVDDMRSAHAL